MKTTITLYIHQLPGKEQRAEICDMSMYQSYGALLGVREIEVEYEPFDVDPVVAMIDNLEQRIAQKRADCTRECNLLLEQISQLKCLEYKPEVHA
ncbi:hypothetical protein E8F20_05940 [Pseudomonas sp. BN415]|uniref:hypothetical protein n=1 Tax=Pseudomonas sp. BN415 TaxID=2567889 RepID=UPI0024546AA9|nr:hypothetical protein [Pseudomonas sp. BN415]MDH4581416.1 hypothetical protein [Pseudomonas sp. BN415]